MPTRVRVMIAAAATLIVALMWGVVVIAQRGGEGTVAAWAAIIALPATIISAAADVWALRRSRQERPIGAVPPAVQGSRSKRQARFSSSVGAVGGPVNKADRDQFNVSGGAVINISNRDS